MTFKHKHLKFKHKHLFFLCAPDIQESYNKSHVKILSYFFIARKKAVYDQFGEEGLKNGVPEGSMESGAWTHGYTFHGDAHKVFREFFGGDNPFSGK